MTYLYLIRHARSTWNAEGRMQGQADPPLDALGHRQAQALAEGLKTETIHAIYSSPLARARDTAEAIATSQGVSVIYDERLTERHLGKWTGLTGSEADEQYPELRAQTGREGWRVAGPPEGENLAQLTARATAAFAEILANHPEARVVVVSHGGTLNAYLSHLMGMPLGTPTHFVLENAALARFRVENGHVFVLGFGDDHHLQALRNL